MINKLWLAGPAVLLLVACEPTQSSNPSLFFEAPENIRELAEPSQDLSAVRINPVDGCYEYRHVGPVETTSLPLRTDQGRPICTRRAAEPA